jgi:hypothetical protein
MTFSFLFVVQNKKGGRVTDIAAHFLVDYADYATASVESPMVYRRFRA